MDFGVWRLVADFTKQTLEDNGANIPNIGTDFLSPGTINYDALVLKIAAAKPGFIVTAFHGDDALKMRLALDSNPVTAKTPTIHVTDTIHIPSVVAAIQEGSPDAMDGLLVRQEGAIHVPITAKTFPTVAKYEARFGHKPGVLYGLGQYEAMWALTRAATAANSLDPDDLVAALEETDYVGALGRIRFYDNHQVQISPTGIPNFVLQWQDDGFKIVWPPASAEASYISP